MPGRTGRGAWFGAGLGLLAGGLSGLLGIGGGILLVPGLVAAGKLTQLEGSASSLLAIIPLAVVGAAVYEVMGGHIRPGLAVLLVVGSLPGTFAGAWVARHVPDRWLRVGFGVTALVSAARLALG